MRYDAIETMTEPAILGKTKILDRISNEQKRTEETMPFSID